MHIYTNAATDTHLLILDQHAISFRLTNLADLPATVAKLQDELTHNKITPYDRNLPAEALLQPLEPPTPAETPADAPDPNEK